MVKRTAKKSTEKKSSGVGAVIAGSLIGLGLIAMGAAIGATIGADDAELRRKVRRLEKRTKALKEMVDDVDERAGRIQVIAPEGTYPPFDQSEDVEA